MTTLPVVREPLHPLQAQLGVTEELTGIEGIQVDHCTICSRARGLSYHHLIFRSQGGHAGPVLPLCLACHENIHNRLWEVVLDSEGIRVVEFTTGDILWRLKRWPQELAGIAASAGDFIEIIDTVQDAIKLMPLIAPALKTDEALEVDRALREMSEGSWKARVRLITEMYEFRLAGLNSDEKVTALGDAFGLRRAQLLNLLAIGRSFAESTLLDESPLEQGFFRESAKTTEPEVWVKVATERKLTNPQFSVDDLSKEIKIADAAAQDNGTEAVLKVPTPSAPPTMRVWGRALVDMKAGDTAWFEKLPVGSDGQPVDLAAYREPIQV